MEGGLILQNMDHRMQNKIIEIDALKGWAIFLVVLGHAIILFPVNLHDNIYCAALFGWLSSFHMPLFLQTKGTPMPSK